MIVPLFMPVRSPVRVTFIGIGINITRSAVNDEKSTAIGARIGVVANETPQSAMNKVRTDVPEAHGALTPECAIRNSALHFVFGTMHRPSAAARYSVWPTFSPVSAVLELRLAFQLRRFGRLGVLCSPASNHD